MEVSEARRLKPLEAENARLKKLLADQMLDNAVLKDRPDDAPGQAGGGVTGHVEARHLPTLSLPTSRRSSNPSVFLHKTRCIGRGLIQQRGPILVIMLTVDNAHDYIFL